VVRVAGSLLFIRHEVEAYKRALVGLPPEPVRPGEVIYFVTVNALAVELSASRATIKRRIKERRLADEAEAAAAPKTTAAAKRSPARRRLEPVGGE